MKNRLSCKVTGEKLMDKQLLVMIPQNLYWTEKRLLNLMYVVKFVGTQVGTPCICLLNGFGGYV